MQLLEIIEKPETKKILPKADKHQDNKCKLGHSFLTELACLINTSYIEFLYMHGFVSDLHISFWTVAWADGPDKLILCLFSPEDQMSWAFVLVPVGTLVLWTCLSWFWSQVNFWFSLFTFYQSLLCIWGIVQVSKYIYLPSWVELSKIFFQQKSLFFLHSVISKMPKNKTSLLWINISSSPNYLPNHHL